MPIRQCDSISSHEASHRDRRLRNVENQDIDLHHMQNASVLNIGGWILMMSTPRTTELNQTLEWSPINTR
jgi:hypothetical protein